VIKTIVIPDFRKTVAALMLAAACLVFESSLPGKADFLNTGETVTEHTAEEMPWRMYCD